MKPLLFKQDQLLSLDGLLMVFIKRRNISQEREWEMMNIVLVLMGIEFVLGIMEIRTLDSNGRMEM